MKRPPPSTVMLHWAAFQENLLGSTRELAGLASKMDFAQKNKSARTQSQYVGSILDPVQAVKHAMLPSVTIIHVGRTITSITLANLTMLLQIGGVKRVDFPASL
jgi:hypothetical protein